jgi:hypothetical protein
MIDKDLREKMFEAAWKKAGYHESKYCDSHSVNSFKEGFNAALDLILPLLEQSLEANRVTVKMVKMMPEMWEVIAHNESRQAIAKIESELKKITGEGK